MNNLCLLCTSYTSDSFKESLFVIYLFIYIDNAHWHFPEEKITFRKDNI